MNLEKKIENIFGNMSNLETLNSYNCRTLLDISEPLMFAINELNKYYLAYTLQNRTALLKNGNKADVVEVLIVNTSISEIKRLLEGQMDIRDALSCGDMYRMGKVGNKVFPRKNVKSFEEIENKIPKIGVRFDRELPNKVNIRKALRLIESEAKIYDSFAISESTFKEEFIQIKVKKLKKFENLFNMENYFVKTFDFRNEEKDGSQY